MCIVRAKHTLTYIHTKNNISHLVITVEISFQATFNEHSERWVYRIGKWSNDRMESGHRKLLANPRATANFISILFFGWSIPLFKRTYNKILDSNDVSEPLVEDRSSILGDRLERYIYIYILHFEWFMSIETDMNV